MQKKILLLLMVLCVTTFSFVGCDKSDSLESTTEQELINYSARIKTGYQFIWLHGDPYPPMQCNLRTNKICLAFVEIINHDNEIDLDINSTPILTGDDGNTYVEVLLTDDSFFFEDDTHSLTIPFEIHSTASDGYSFLLPEGVYEIDYELGELGGYRLPLLVN